MYMYLSNWFIHCLCRAFSYTEITCACICVAGACICVAGACICVAGACICVAGACVCV